MSEMFRQLKCNNSLINVGQCHGCFSSVWLLVSFLIFWTPCSIVMSTLVSVLTPRSDPVILLSAHLGSRPDIVTFFFPKLPATQHSSDVRSARTRQMSSTLGHVRQLDIQRIFLQMERLTQKPYYIRGGSILVLRYRTLGQCQ